MSLVLVAAICGGHLEAVGDLKGNTMVPAVLGGEPELVAAA